MAADSRGAAAFAAWRTALTRRLCAGAGPRAAARRHASTGRCSPPTSSSRVSVGLALEPLATRRDAVRHRRTPARDRGAGRRGRPPGDLGRDPRARPTHGFHLADADLDPPELPARRCPGDIDTVRCTGWLPAITDECYRGSVARYVWDLADRARSGWVVPLGAAGDPRSPAPPRPARRLGGGAAAADRADWEPHPEGGSVTRRLSTDPGRGDREPTSRRSPTSRTAPTPRAEACSGAVLPSCRPHRL